MRLRRSGPSGFPTRHLNGVIPNGLLHFGGNKPVMLDLLSMVVQLVRSSPPLTVWAPHSPPHNLSTLLRRDQDWTKQREEDA